MEKFIYQLETEICGQYRRYRVGVDNVVSIQKLYEHSVKEYIFIVNYTDGIKIDVTSTQMIVEWHPKHK